MQPGFNCLKVRLHILYLSSTHSYHGLREEFREAL